MTLVRHLRPLLVVTSFFLFGAPAVPWARGLTAPTARAVEQNNRGAKLLGAGELLQAEQALKTAIALSPDYAEAYNNLGLLYKQRDLLDLAMQQFQKAAALNPDYASAYNHMGAVHIARGEYDQAVKVVDRALKKEPAFADAFYTKGLAYFLKGRAQTNDGERKTLYHLAETQFSKATQLNPKLTIAHKNMGDLYTEMGNYEQAAIRYRLALEDDPNAATTWDQLANIYRLMGDMAKAQNAAAKGREAKALTQASDHYAAGMKALMAGETKRSARDTKGASGQFNEAIKGFARALLANPKWPEAAYYLGVAYQRQGETVLARKAWEQTLAIAPDHPGALYNLGTVEDQGGAKEAAMEHLCRFLAIGSAQFPAEAQAVRNHLREQKVSCRR